MDILKEKQYNTKNSDYLSRYFNFPFYYNTEDQKYIYGITSNLSKDTPYVVVKIKAETTLDYLANKYYGRPDYYWIIADFNSIQDPFIKLSDYFEFIKIPSLSEIEFGK